MPTGVVPVAMGVSGGELSHLSDFGCFDRYGESCRAFYVYFPYRFVLTFLCRDR